MKRFNNTALSVLHFGSHFYDLFVHLSVRWRTDGGEWSDTIELKPLSMSDDEVFDWTWVGGGRRHGPFSAWDDHWMS